MDSQHNRSVTCDYVYFFSNAKKPLNVLSNFHACEFTLGGVTYPSSEHAFQAQLIPPEYRYFFSTAGPLSTMRSGFETLMPSSSKEAIDKKVLFWGKKNNIGILAKMASKRDYLLTDLGVYKKNIEFDECRIIFKSVLVARHDASAEFREVLEGTNNKYLLEFDRSAVRRALETPPHVNRWAGMIVDSKVIGHNQTGQLMMWLRGYARACLQGMPDDWPATHSWPPASEIERFIETHPGTYVLENGETVHGVIETHLKYGAPIEDALEESHAMVELPGSIS